jgi:hypothetical protein
MTTAITKTPNKMEMLQILAKAGKLAEYRKDSEKDSVLVARLGSRFSVDKVKELYTAASTKAPKAKVQKAVPEVKSAKANKAAKEEKAPAVESKARAKKNPVGFYSDDINNRESSSYKPVSEGSHTYKKRWVKELLDHYNFGPIIDAGETAIRSLPTAKKGVIVFSFTKNSLTVKTAKGAAGKAIKSTLVLCPAIAECFIKKYM